MEIKENKNFRDRSKTNHILAPAALEKKKKVGGEGGENELAIFSKLPVRGIGQLGVGASVGGGSV